MLAQKPPFSTGDIVRFGSDRWIEHFSPEFIAPGQTVLVVSKPVKVYNSSYTCFVLDGGTIGFVHLMEWVDEVLNT